MGFNCGSTFGVSGGLWVLAGRSATTTLVSAMGGGVAAVIFRWVEKYMVPSIYEKLVRKWKLEPIIGERG